MRRSIGLIGVVVVVLALGAGAAFAQKSALTAAQLNRKRKSVLKVILAASGLGKLRRRIVFWCKFGHAKAWRRRRRRCRVVRSHQASAGDTQHLWHYHSRLRKCGGAQNRHDGTLPVRCKLDALIKRLESRQHGGDVKLAGRQV